MAARQQQQPQRPRVSLSQSPIGEVHIFEIKLWYNNNHDDYHDYYVAPCKSCTFDLRNPHCPPPFPLCGSSGARGTGSVVDCAAALRSPTAAHEDGLSRRPPPVFTVHVHTIGNYIRRDRSALR
ncbi:unnamed protein product [Lampetra planeri]